MYGYVGISRDRKSIYIYIYIGIYRDAEGKIRICRGLRAYRLWGV